MLYKFDSNKELTIFILISQFVPNCHKMLKHACKRHMTDTNNQLLSLK